MPLLCQQGMPVSGSLARVRDTALQMTICHSLSSHFHPSSLLDPNWDGGRQEMRIWRCREEEKWEEWETFMYYVRKTQHSVFGGRWCRTTLSLPLTRSAPFALILWAFSGVFSRTPPSLSIPLGSHRPCKGLGGGGTEQEGGRKANGGIVERARLKQRAKRGCVNKRYKLCRKFHVISVFHTISKVSAIYRSKCVFFYSPMNCRGGNAEFISLSQSV